MFTPRSIFSGLFFVIIASGCGSDNNKPTETLPATDPTGGTNPNTSAKAQIDESKARYFAVLNNQYRYVILIAHNSNGVTLSGLSSAKLIPQTGSSQNLVIAASGDITYANMTEDRLKSVKDVFSQMGITIDEIKIRNKMADYRQVFLRKSTIPAGAYTLELTFTLSNGTSVTITDSFNLAADARY